jgi:hypothetical protein
MMREGRCTTVRGEGIPDVGGAGGRAESLWPIRSEPHEHPETDPLGTRMRLGDTRRGSGTVIPRHPLKMS